MGKEKIAERVVDFWRLLEFFTQDNYPMQGTQQRQNFAKLIRATDLKPYRKMKSKEIFHQYKFVNFPEKIEEVENVEKLLPLTSSDVHLFVGKINRNSIIEKLFELVQEGELIEKNKSKICMFSLKMTADNKYKKGSLCVSPLLWGTAIINKYGSGVKSLQNNLTIANYQETIKEIESNKELFKEDQTVSAEFLFNLYSCIKRWFIDHVFKEISIEEDITMIYTRFKDKETFQKLDDSLEDHSDLINGFYQNDLEMVLRLLKEGKSPNDLFLDYICSQEDTISDSIDERKKYNVRENDEFLQGLLNPKCMPLGKWPSGYRPSLMQQAAINQYLQGQEEVFSVNGPPGTGKTTLLKEIVADNVIKRAKLFSRYNKADEAFQKENFLDGEKNNNGYDNFFSVYYSLKDTRIKDYGMLVASSNNAAVENITKELPGLSNLLDSLKAETVMGTRGLFELGKAEDRITVTNEFINEQHKKEKQTIDVPDIYFSSLAQNLKDQDFDLSQIENYSEWGLISAPLGKRKNVSTYFFRVVQPLISQIDNKSNREWNIKRYKETREKFLNQYNYVIKLQEQARRYSRIYERHEKEKKVAELKHEKILSSIYQLELFMQRNKQTIIENQIAIEKSKNELDKLKQEKGEAAEILSQDQLILETIKSSELKKEQQLIKLEDDRKLLEILAYKFLKKTSKRIEKIQEEYAALSEIKQSLKDIKKQIKEKRKEQDSIDQKIAGVQINQRELEKMIKEEESGNAQCQVEILNQKKEAESIKCEMIRLEKIQTTEVQNLEKRITLLNPTFFLKMHAGSLEEKIEVQKSIPWVTEELDRAREKLFYDALQVNKYFVLSSQRVRSNLKNLGYMWKLIKPINEEYCNFSTNDRKISYKHLLNTLFLITPVISTTFASVSRFLSNIEDVNSLGQLIIDEAGQSTPQMAIGAMWRFKKTIIVGDPKQVEPIVTEDVNAIKKIFRTEELAGYMDKSLSVQTFADKINPYGSYIEQEDQDDLWVGCPLIIHRRCIEPMFSISNQLSYGNTMLSQTEEPEENLIFTHDSSCWIDIAGKENGNKDHYVKEQALKAVEIVDKAFATSDGVPDIYLISPFTTVVKGFINLILQESEYKDRDEMQEWLDNNCGTVHKFQGKEAKEVIFLLGCDYKAKGAVKWVNDNIVNVAVTRAKYRLYVIGDRDLWKINSSLSVVQEYL